MIINSNFRDIYDCMLSNGVDTSIVYNRYTQIFQGEEIPDIFKNLYGFNEVQRLGDALGSKYMFNEYTIKPIIINIGSFHKTAFVIQPYSVIGPAKVDKVALIDHYDQLVPTLKSFGIKYEVDPHVEYHRRPLYEQFLRYKNQKVKDEVLNCVVERPIYQELPCSQIDIINDIYRQYRSPIVVITRLDSDNSLAAIVNPCLKDIPINKFIDSLTVMNNIEECFINTINMTSMSVPNMDDVVMRDSKGFDNFSFKKQPTKSYRIKKK